MKLFIFLSVFFLGCKSTEIRKSCKRNLELELSKNWRYDAVKKGYISNSKFLTELDSLYKDCLHGMDTTKIAKLFGNNYVISQRGIENDFLMNYPITLAS